MLKRNKMLSWAGIASAILLAGCCCSAEEEKDGAGKCGKTPASGSGTICCCCFLGSRTSCPVMKANCPNAEKKISEKCIKKIRKAGEALASLCKGDQKAFAAHLPEAKRVQGEVKAAETVKKLGADQGKVKSAELVATLNKPQQEVTVWKLGVLVPGPDGEVEADTLFQIVFAPDSDEIIDFGIF